MRVYVWGGSGRSRVKESYIWSYHMKKNYLNKRTKHVINIKREKSIFHITRYIKI